MKNALVYACFLSGKWYSLVNNQLNKIFSSDHVKKGGDVFICASGSKEEYEKLLEMTIDSNQHHIQYLFPPILAKGFDSK